uniref:Neuropilin 2b n=1 Tax=Erpetoichthys calabaricus TaxID=27687 RepID=A0A8C4RYS6_ERPCA
MEVSLKFTTFDLENDPLQIGEGDCKYDWLEVWDGLPQVGPLIGRYCGVKMPPEFQSSTGVLSLSFHTDMAVAKDGFSARYSMTAREVTDCEYPFGIESGKITDEQITSSTSFYDNRWLPQFGRLNNDNNAWTPNEDTNREYIQVDLLFLRVLTGIATQGAISKETGNVYYVTSFKLEVSTNGEDWMMYRHGKNHKVPVFHANTDPTEVVLNRIPQAVLARFVRIRPQAWHKGIALRFELYGCQITDAPCSEMQGMLSGLIPDSRITSSSAWDIHWSPGFTRLVASRSGWFPEKPHPLPGEEWLQVDLGVPKMVKGVIIQGARGVSVNPGSTAAENRAFIRKFRVAHSMNGIDWAFITDTKLMQPKVFEGNVHYDTPEIRRFDATPAQYVRIYPERWSPAGIGMRLEILGCDLLVSLPCLHVVQWPPGWHPLCQQMFLLCPEVFDFFETFSCEFGTAEKNDLCGWTHDPSSNFNWGFYPRNTGSTLGSGNFLHVEASPKTSGQSARLLSPLVPPDEGPLCVVFWYQMRGSKVGALRLSLKNAGEQTPLWIVRGDQGTTWREGRAILPRSPLAYQIVLEAEMGLASKGDIAVDSIHLSAHIPLNKCELRATSTAVPVTHVPDKDKNWLYTLDPILVTIIAMSSLGVLLGAVCAGLLLYCTCSYHGLSSRSSTTLENYNFELYDGIKHKVKLNQQRCCSEA